MSMYMGVADTIRYLLDRDNLPVNISKGIEFAGYFNVSRKTLNKGVRVLMNEGYPVYEYWVNSKVFPGNKFKARAIAPKNYSRDDVQFDIDNHDRLYLLWFHQKGYRKR